MILSWTTGLPPADVLEDVAHAWAQAGLDVVECLRRCTAVTNEWIYAAGTGPLRDRFSPRLISERTVPVAHRNLDQIINPQPEALKVYQNLLAWIDEVDLASQRRMPRPPFTTPHGDPIFPDEDTRWWLTDIQRRRPDELPAGDEDGPASEVEEEKEDTDDDDPTSEEGEIQAGAGDLSSHPLHAF